MRLNRYLAMQKIASRRGADDLIKQGKVKVNGRTAKLGDRVLENDSVTVDSKTLERLEKTRVFLAYHKPSGVVTTLPQKNEKSIADILKYKEKIFPIGRLDKDSHGLIILTNDGRITDAVLNPGKDHEKEYLVRVDKKIRPGFLRHVSQGVNLGGYTTKPARIEKVSDSTFRIILTEGKNRQIRKICAAFKYEVRDLRRVRVMNIKLGTLQPNQFRKIRGAELEEFLAAV